MINTRLNKWLPILSCLAMLAGCGKGSSDDEGGGAAAAVASSLTGSVKSSTGGQSEMARWVVAFIERDSGSARVADIDTLGNYAIPALNINIPQTVVLLDSQYRLSSVLSYPGLTAGTVRQFFTFASGTAPALVQSGPIVQFADVSTITFEKDIAADADLDNIPDGIDTSAAFSVLNTNFAFADPPKVDTDKDSTLNYIDADLDGDGLVNWVDSDDDGDGFIDIFDVDADGDSVVDTLTTFGDHYFGEGLLFGAVQVVQTVQSDGTLSTALVFTARLKGDIIPTAVAVRGPSSLFDGSTLMLAGAATTQTWDKTLADDGGNEDGAAGDGVYSRKIVLATGKSPRPNQMVFIQLQSQVGGVTVYNEYPFMFPNLTTAAVSGAYTASSLTVTMQGAPFSGVTDFVWSVHVYDSAGTKVFSSEPIKGTTSTYILPDTILDDGQTYTAVIVASSLDRIPSYPSWIVRSAAFQLQ